MALFGKNGTLRSTLRFLLERDGEDDDTEDVFEPEEEDSSQAEKEIAPSAPVKPIAPAKEKASELFDHASDPADSKVLSERWTGKLYAFATGEKREIITTPCGKVLSLSSEQAAYFKEIAGKIMRNEPTGLPDEEEKQYRILLFGEEAEKKREREQWGKWNTGDSPKKAKQGLEMRWDVEPPSQKEKEKIEFDWGLDADPPGKKQETEEMKWD